MKNIINAIYKLTVNKTLITHDSDILKIIDRIIVIDSVKIIEDNYLNK